MATGERNPIIPRLRRVPSYGLACQACRDEGRFYSHPRRLYVRGARGRGYVPVGYVCAFGHVTLDEPEPPPPA